MKIDLTNDRPGDLDAVRMPAGWYLTTCTSHETGQEHEEIIWKFRVESALFKGQTIESRLSNPDMAATDQDAAGQMKRLKIWLKRLGLVSDADIGKNVEVNFAGCVGKQFVVKLEDNRFIGKKGDEVNIPRPGYAGVFPLTHDEIPAEERMRLGLPLLPGQSLPVPGAAAEPAKRGRKPKEPAAAAAGQQNIPQVPVDFSDI